MEKQYMSQLIRQGLHEKVEILRDNFNNLRDRAMSDFLLSTGIRVGELVRLNIDDIDFSEREWCGIASEGNG